MILQERISSVPAIRSQKPRGKVTESLTLPDQGINIKYAMEQYKRGQLVEKVKGYYEKEGMVSPDFSMMTRLQKLQALADFRKMRAAAETEMIRLHNDAKTKHNESLAKKKAEEANRRSDPDGSKPDAK